MINTIKIFTIIVGIIILVSDLKNYIKGNNRNITIYMQCVFFFFYYIPLICDVFYIRPQYSKYYYGFLKSYDNIKIEIIYCLIVTYINYMFHYFQKKNVYKINFKDININNRISSYIIMLIMSVILIYVFFKIDNHIWKAIINYNMRAMRTDIATQLKTIALVIIGLALIFIAIENRPKTIKIKILFVLPILLFACALNGKRTAVFMCVIGILMILILKNLIKSKKNLIIIILLSATMLLLYGNLYNKSVTKDDDEYLSYRINYCRDDTLKMTIYSELNNKPILEYRGQTLLYYLTFYIKRATFPTKPYPYATYFTAYLMNLDNVVNLGWNMTTSIYDEILSNFGWIGIILIPFIMNKCLNGIAKRNKGTLGKGILFLGILDMILLLAVQASAFLFLYIALIILIIIYDIKENFNNKKDKRKIYEKKCFNIL